MPATLRINHAHCTYILHSGTNQWTVIQSEIHSVNFTHCPSLYKGKALKGYSMLFKLSPCSFQLNARHVRQQKLPKSSDLLRNVLDFKTSTHRQRPELVCFRKPEIAYKEPLIRIVTRVQWRTIVRPFFKVLRWTDSTLLRPLRHRTPDGGVHFIAISLSTSYFSFDIYKSILPKNNDTCLLQMHFYSLS